MKAFKNFNVVSMILYVVIMTTSAVGICYAVAAGARHHRGIAATRSLR